MIFFFFFFFLFGARARRARDARAEGNGEGERVPRRNGASYNFANCSKLLDSRCEEFEHVEPESVCGALTRGGSVRVRVAGSPDSRMYYNGTVTPAG